MLGEMKLFFGSIEIGPNRIGPNGALPWQRLEEVHYQGLAKLIGLSNFNSKQLERVVKN